MASSVFVYNLSPSIPNVASVFYSALTKLPDNENSYFNLQLLSDNELTGEHITVQMIEESFYNTDSRNFDRRRVPKASVVFFSICNDRLEIWGSKSNTNRLVFALSTATNNRISINSITVSIEEIIERLRSVKAKVAKVYFEDFLFSEDIVGNFTIDLSSYGDAFSVLDKYKDKVSKMVFILPSDSMQIKLSFSSKGTIVVYKPRELIENDAMYLLHSILP